MDVAATRRSPRISSGTRGSSSKRKLTVKMRRSTSRSPVRTSAEKRRDRRKRRSSIKRRSLVAALESIRSSTTPPAKEKRESALTKVQERHESEEYSDKNSKSTTKTTVPDGSTSTGLAAANHNNAVVSDQRIESSDQPDEDKHLIPLRAELEGWMEQKQKYKALEKSAKEEATSRVYFPPSELQADALLSKYRVYSEQIDDLNDKLSSAVQSVSNTLNVVYKIQELHKINLKKVTEAEVAKVSDARGGNDPRWLMERLFELENMTSQI